MHQIAGSMCTRLDLLDELIEASIRCKQHSNAVGALKLQAQLTRLLEGSWGKID